MYSAFLKMIGALESLSRDYNGHPCFCQMSIGNPMLRGKHTDTCINARLALYEARNVGVTATAGTSHALIQILKELGWVVTDPDCNQMMKQISEDRFLLREDRIINPVSKEIKVYESEIGYSFNEMCSWIDEGKDLSLIAECIFEMEEM